MKHRVLILIAALATVLTATPGSAPAQLLGGSSLFGDSGLLGGSLLSGPGLNLPGFHLSLDLNTGVAGSMTSSLNSTVTRFSWRAPSSSLLGGLDAFTRRDTDVASLLSRFDGFGFPGTDSVYSLSPDHLLPLHGLMSGNRSRGLLQAGAGNAASPFYYGWTASGYITNLSLPVLRDFGPLGALLQSTGTP